MLLNWGSAMKSGIEEYRLSNAMENGKSEQAMWNRCGIEVTG
jgi:hypothetical protein